VFSHTRADRGIDHPVEDEVDQHHLTKRCEPDGGENVGDIDRDLPLRCEPPGQNRRRFPMR